MKHQQIISFLIALSAIASVSIATSADHRLSRRGLIKYVTRLLPNRDYPADDALLVRNPEAVDLDDLRSRPPAVMPGAHTLPMITEIEEEKSDSNTETKLTTFDQDFISNDADLLGDGAYGIVRRATRKSDGEVFAAKFITKSEIQSSKWVHDPRLGYIPNELYVLTYANHLNIIRAVSFYETAEQYIIIQEMFGYSRCSLLRNRVWELPTLSVEDCDMPRESSDLRNFLDKSEIIIDERYKTRVRNIFKQILDAVIHLYDKLGFVHGDIKPENILIDLNDRIKLIDFGSASQVFDDAQHEGHMSRQLVVKSDLAGTSHYLPYELVEESEAKYSGQRADVYSLGLLLLELISGNSILSFEERPRNDMIARIAKNDPLLGDLLTKCTVTDPTKRGAGSFTFKKMIDHPWMQQSSKGSFLGRHFTSLMKKNG